jgi:GT2 family glycosyltransferase
MPLISVIIVNWNRAELLRSCLLSLQHQHDAPAFEVIVVDNGSSDSSLTVLESLRLEVHFPIQVIANIENHGFCRANNQGIAAASAEWVALLNNDAEAQPGWLASMYKAVAERPDYGMVACKILVYEDPSKIDKAGHLIYLDGQNRGRGSGQVDRGQYDRVEEVLWPDGCAAMYKAAMLKEIGGFDEDLFAYGDDAELGMRARVAGWKCLYVPGAVVLHRRGSTLGVLSSRRIELIERNRILLAVKHFPLSVLWANGFYCAARLTAGALAGLRGRGEAGRFRGAGEKWRLAKALLRGSIQGLRMTPATWRKRQSMRKLRRLSPKEVRELLQRYRITLKELSEQAI